MAEAGVDPLFGPDGTGGGSLGGADPIGEPLPGFVLPALDLPVMGADGRVTGLAGGDIEPDGVDLDLDRSDLDLVPEPDDIDAMPEAGTVAWLVAQRAALDRLATRSQAPEEPAAPVAPAPDVPTPHVTAPASAAAPDPGAAPAPAHPRPPALDPGRADPQAPVIPVQARPVTVPRSESPIGPGHRPPIEEELSILGLSRHSRGRLGSRMFTWVFIAVFVVILVQLIVSLLNV